MQSASWAPGRSRISGASISNRNRVVRFTSAPADKCGVQVYAKSTVSKRTGHCNQADGPGAASREAAEILVVFDRELAPLPGE